MNGLTSAWTHLNNVVSTLKRQLRWKKKTLVVGPSQPVDGDSLGCTIALIRHLRKQGKEAFTLPTLTMFPQLAWMVTADVIHPACLSQCGPQFTTSKLQEMFDAVIAQWQPDEIVLVDGQVDRLGFDPGNIPVYTIDHHVQAGTRDDKDAFIQPAPAAGCLLIENFGVYEPILVVSILTDTFWLRESTPSDAIDSLYALRKRGGLTNDLLVEYQQKLKVPKDLEVLRAMRSCELHIEDGAVLAFVDDTRPDIHRGVMGDLGYYFSHLCVVRGDGYVSMRTNNDNAKLDKLAESYGCGGHKSKAVVRFSSVKDRTPVFELWKKFLTEINRTT